MNPSEKETYRTMELLVWYSPGCTKGMATFSSRTGLGERFWRSEAERARWRSWVMRAALRNPVSYWAAVNEPANKAMLRRSKQIDPRRAPRICIKDNHWCFLSFIIVRL